MDDYVLTLYDENGAPVPIPAIQGIGIKNIRFKEAGENEDTYEIVLDDETAYTFTVKHGVSPSIMVGLIQGNPLYSQRNGAVITIVNADGSKHSVQLYDGIDGRDGTSVSITDVEYSHNLDTEVGSTTFTFSDGHAFTVRDGRRGEPGITPHIGENGNWFIGTTDTGVPATGSFEDSALPEHTEVDEGKFLRIVGGSPTWQAVVNGEEVKF